MTLGEKANKNKYLLLIAHLLLILVYFFAYKWIRSSYPIPHISWDGDYYIDAALHNDFCIRPPGYPFFIRTLFNINPALTFLVKAQFATHFIAVTAFLLTVKRIFNINIFLYTVLGLVLLLEPVALYHNNSILSDQLFAACTLLSLSTLLLFIHTGKYVYFLIHIPLLFACIEIRHIGLFYPFFSVISLLLFLQKRKLAVISSLSIIFIYVLLNKLHVHYNTKEYSSAVYSPFSGWTHANNALYGYWYADINGNDIEDPEIRDFYYYIKRSFDSTGFRDPNVGSGYLWNDKSPLVIYNRIGEDSLKQNHGYQGKEVWARSWYLTAPKYAKFGMYFQMHYPMAYIKGYIAPNLATLVIPHTGEMADYYIAPTKDEVVLAKYRLKAENITAIAQPYKEWLNKYIDIGYVCLLSLFVASSLIFLVVFREFDKQKRNTAFMLMLFVAIYYALMLYSSWFMYRYLLAVFPLMITFVAIILSFLTGKIIKHRRQKEQVLP